GLVKACGEVDLFLACRHTKTAWIKAWAEVSSLRRASQMFLLGRHSLHRLTSFRCRLVAFHRWARADEMPVAVGVVYPVAGAPILVAQERFDREARERACIRAIPVFIREIENGVRCVLENVVFAIHRLFLDRSNLRTN